MNQNEINKQLEDAVEQAVQMLCEKSGLYGEKNLEQINRMWEGMAIAVARVRDQLDGKHDNAHVFASLAVSQERMYAELRAAAVYLSARGFNEFEVLQALGLSDPTPEELDMAQLRIEAEDAEEEAEEARLAATRAGS